MPKSITSSLANYLIIGELLDNAHQPLDPNMTDKKPHMGAASLAEQGEEGRMAWNDKVGTI
jgi:hypothetical protein